MKRNILIVDDVKDQAEGLTKALTKILPDYSFEYRSEEKSNP